MEIIWPTDNKRLPKAVVFWRPRGQRSNGRPKTTFNRIFRSETRAVNISDLKAAKPGAANRER